MSRVYSKREGPTEPGSAKCSLPMEPTSEPRTIKQPIDAPVSFSGQSTLFLSLHFQSLASLLSHVSFCIFV